MTEEEDCKFEVSMGFKTEQEAKDFVMWWIAEGIEALKSWKIEVLR